MLPWQLVTRSLQKLWFFATRTSTIWLKSFFCATISVSVNLKGTMSCYTEHIGLMGLSTILDSITRFPAKFEGTSNQARSMSSIICPMKEMNNISLVSPFFFFPSSCWLRPLRWHIRLGFEYGSETKIGPRCMYSNQILQNIFRFSLEIMMHRWRISGQ